MPWALALKLLGIGKLPTWMNVAIGSPWSPATPGAKYCGALMPLEAVSTGSPGMDTGAPGRPGLASRISSRMSTRSAGSGFWIFWSLTSAVAVTLSEWGASRTNRRLTVIAPPVMFTG